MDPKDAARVMLGTKELCCPFDTFHETIEAALERPVFTHEFASAHTLWAELAGEKDPPSLQEIIELIPEEKRVILVMSA